MFIYMNKVLFCSVSVLFSKQEITNGVPVSKYDRKSIDSCEGVSRDVIPEIRTVLAHQ